MESVSVETVAEQDGEAGKQTYVTEEFSQIDTAGDVLGTLGAKLDQVGHLASDLLPAHIVKGDYGAVAAS